MTQNYHIPVLLKETIEALNIQEDRWYVDGTLGGGGHSEHILERGGNVIGIDQDSAAIDFVSKAQNSKRKAQNGGKLILVRDNFRNIKRIVEENGLGGKVLGVLFDLGVSSHQIDASGRGFSIRREEVLDMRMNQNGELTAWEVVNKWREEQLEEVVSRYGEEEQASKIARAIVEARQEKKIETSQELGHIIEKAVRRPVRQAQGFASGIHPATRTFMALRIVVNDELAVIEEGLRGGFEVLESGGRMVVISFHSLEDRIVKRMFLEFERNGKARIVTKKPIIASEEEVRVNRRARSAKLRVIEKM